MRGECTGEDAVKGGQRGGEELGVHRSVAVEQGEVGAGALATQPRVQPGGFESAGRAHAAILQLPPTAGSTSQNILQRNARN
eukprot:6602537-Pyramimonas_sp.AAC.1